MRRIKTFLAVGVAIALSACSGSAPLSDSEIKDLVRSVAPQQSRCIENTQGVLISCAAGTNSGQLYVYVPGNDKNVLHVNADLSALASIGAMASFFDYVREAVGKLGLAGKDYQKCTDMGDGRQSSSYRLKGYSLECVTYTRMATLKFEMKFTRR